MAKMSLELEELEHDQIHFFVRESYNSLMDAIDHFRAEEKRKLTS